MKLQISNGSAVIDVTDDNPIVTFSFEKDGENNRITGHYSFFVQSMEAAVSNSEVFATSNLAQQFSGYLLSLGFTKSEHDDTFSAERKGHSCYLNVVLKIWLSNNNFLYVTKKMSIIEEDDGEERDLIWGLKIDSIERLKWVFEKMSYISTFISDPIPHKVNLVYGITS